MMKPSSVISCSISWHFMNYEFYWCIPWINNNITTEWVVKKAFHQKLNFKTAVKKWKASQSIWLMPVVTWRYLSWRAAGDCSMIWEASRKAFEALISPSAAITLARASRLASASAAMARWSCSGNLASFLKN